MGFRPRLQPGFLHVGHSDALMLLRSILGMTHLLQQRAHSMALIQAVEMQQHEHGSITATYLHWTSINDQLSFLAVIPVRQSAC